MVFIYDNSVERELIKKMFLEICVPEFHAHLVCASYLKTAVNFHYLILYTVEDLCGNG